MLNTGILNPHLLSLLARTRHTNTLVLADRGFPSWPNLETIDLSLTDDVPTVLQVLEAILKHWRCGQVSIAQEFQTGNPPQALANLQAATAGIPLRWQTHSNFKLLVPAATGLIRTGDTLPYSNMILESA